MKRLWWSIFRVCFLVDWIVIWSILLVRWFPPADNNYALAFGAILAYNAAILMVYWAFLPGFGKMTLPKPEMPDDKAIRCAHGVKRWGSCRACALDFVRQSKQR